MSLINNDLDKMMLKGERIKSICEENQLSITTENLESLQKYVSLLLKWNKKINLISRKDTENIWVQHILASVSFLFKFKLLSSSSILDIGTGGGLPGIPIAILNPDIKVVLLESIKKKVNVVKVLIEELRLSNSSIVCGRAEELGAVPELHHRFDYIISRAVASARDIIEWSWPFLVNNLTAQNHPINTRDGRFIIPERSVLLLKGGDVKKEIEEAQLKFRLKSVKVHQIKINGIDSSELTDKKLIIIQL